MSTEENKAILQRAMDKFSPQTKEQYLSLYDPGCVLHGYVGVEPGLDGIRRFYEAFWNAFPDVVLTNEGMLAEGDEVACRFSLKATHQGEFNGIPPSGKPIHLTGITILKFANGKCIERWSEADWLGMLQQLGVIPAPEAVTA
jgi:predicted ester cyclase